MALLGLAACGTPARPEPPAAAPQSTPAPTPPTEAASPRYRLRFAVGEGPVLGMSRGPQAELEATNAMRARR